MTKPLNKPTNDIMSMPERELTNDEAARFLKIILQTGYFPTRYKGDYVWLYIIAALNKAIEVLEKGENK